MFAQHDDGPGSQSGIADSGPGVGLAFDLLDESFSLVEVPFDRRAIMREGDWRIPGFHVVARGAFAQFQEGVETGGVPGG